jgi:ABC-type uncharacterized transport system ATPase subunit
MSGIVKRFPGVLANDHVDLEVRPGEVHCLLGENGAGKTTLMNILYGLYSCDEGEIRVDGRPVDFRGPSDAIRHGIGMVHQHFMLVPVFTVLDNIVLGAEPTRGCFIDRDSARQRIFSLARDYNLPVELDAQVQDISVGIQQRAEILKLLYRGARIMILDEPTAVLTPQEVDDLFKVIRALKGAGCTIIFITHKLREVIDFSDRVSVLRGGRRAATLVTAETDAAKLVRLMVGREVAPVVRQATRAKGRTVARVEDITARNQRQLPALRGVTLEVSEGEILGVAGVEGNGQNELAEILTGHRKPTRGTVTVHGRDMTGRSPKEFLHAGVAFIPADRLRDGLVPEFPLYENTTLGYQDSPPFANGMLLDLKAARSFCERIVREFEIKTVSTLVPSGVLSGGNQQKLVIGRELRRDPRLLVAVQPTRGLDVAATEYVHSQLVQAREQGKAVILISLELGEILALSDRILVMFEGRIAGEFTAGEVSREHLGLCMAGGGAR